MLAALYRRTGPPDEVLELVELPDPEPGPGEVRVRLRAAGINPTDTKARAGFRGRPIGFEYQIPGQDGAGEIDRVGEGVGAAREGQRVWVFHAALGRPAGTSAQYVVVPAWQAVPLGTASFETGAALGIPFLTAHRALFRDGALGGATVLVAGGAGAVGNAAVQLAKRGGARVLATVSSDEKARLAARAGADVVVIGYDRVDEIRSHAPTASTASSRSRSRRTSSSISACSRRGARSSPTPASPTTPGSPSRASWAPASGSTSCSST